MSQEPVSLETPIGEEEDSHLGDFIEGSDAVVPVDAASHPAAGAARVGAAHAVRAREEGDAAAVRAARRPPRTLEEVEREFGVTRERVRRIESKTLSKLRHPSRSQKLRDYLE